MVFDIQRFSTHDGPGIRTTVFLKGCPLRCLWCHNPESMSSSPELMFTAQKCIGCGACFEVCPNNALDPHSEQRIIRDRCEGCGTCADACPSRALEIAGEMKTVTEVIGEVQKDKVFYDNSGGGITVSGGEPLYQPEFTRTLLACARENGMHTALDTSGHVRWPKLESVLPYVDLILYDLKHMDTAKHKQLTGVPNDTILSNIECLVQTRVEIVVRIPVVPGCNTGDHNLEDTATFIASLDRAPAVNLLPYHAMAESKYQRLGKPYPLKGTKAPDDEFMESAKSLFTDKGLRVLE